MKQLLLLLLAACTLGLAATDPKTALTGTVKDADNADLLIGATVKILKNRELIKETRAGADGQYRLELEPGVYEVECAYTGYITQRLTEVQITVDKEKKLNFKLKIGATLYESVVINYNSRRMESEEMVGGELTSDEIRTRPARKIEAKDREPDALREEPARTKFKSSAKPAPYSAEKAKTSTAPDAKPAPADESAYSPDKEISPVSTDMAMEVVRDKKMDDAGTVVMPPPGGPTQPAPRAGLLTAGEWNDLHNWNNHWADLLTDGEIEPYQKMYGFYPRHRYTVLLTNEQDFPIADAVVQLKTNGATIWEARTDNTGKAELWADLFETTQEPSPKSMGKLVTAEAWLNGKKYDFDALKPAKDGINFLKINVECHAPKNVDIVWAVDATGSMGDEIEYLKTELLDVINRAKGRNPGLAFRMGTVFYRDKSDEYITKSSGLSPDISQTVEFIKKQFADGGGDYPEAVHSALEEAVFSQKWSENAIARICFLVLDASPHQTPEVSASLQKSIREAARRGIRIVPVTASGIQKDTEFLMKFFGLATNGTYVFLTDHSGIGGKHLEPTSDEYKVEPLNELLVRLITEYTTIETCEGKAEIRFADDPQQQQQQHNNWQAFYYPNPASTQFTLELPFDVESVTIYDAEGKAVRKIEKPKGGQHTVVVSDLAIGFYTIRILKDGRMQSGKLMVVRA